MRRLRLVEIEDGGGGDLSRGRRQYHVQRGAVQILLILLLPAARRRKRLRSLIMTHRYRRRMERVASTLKTNFERFDY